MLENNDNVITYLAERASIKAYQQNDKIITQYHTDTDLYFILAGRVAVIRNGIEIDHQGPGSTIGDTASVDPSSYRYVTVVASEPTILASVSRDDFASIADKYPFLWKQIAKELSDRLRRGRWLGISRLKSRVFIASASEELAAAMKLADLLKSDSLDIDLWPNVFIPGETYIESLERELDQSDFALLFFSGDDSTVSRGLIFQSPRDNVVFELGLFTGKLTRARAIILQKDGLDIKIPTDLLGVKTIKYNQQDLSGPVAILNEHFSTLKPR